jgi:hypothetical protein
MPRLFENLLKTAQKVVHEMGQREEDPLFEDFSDSIDLRWKEVQGHSLPALVFENHVPGAVGPVFQAVCLFNKFGG